jgi:hypothetical protein
LSKLNFSQRVGLVPIDSLPLLDDISFELRNSFYNVIYQNLFPQHLNTSKLTAASKIFAESADEYFFSRPVSNLEVYQSDYRDRILKWFQSAPWNKVYEFLEWCICYEAERQSDRNSTGIKFLSEALNAALERHNSGYRMVELVLIPITDQNELAEVEASIGQIGQFSTIGTHIKSAANLLNPASNPNYRNSIKESISAVEAAAKIVTGKDNITLGPALTWLEQNAGLHNALKVGFSSMYGWTSNADGIRHALMDVDKITFEEAKYMLVSCSAFANDLISVYSKSVEAK